jgi:hypothetical protein
MRLSAIVAFVLVVLTALPALGVQRMVVFEDFTNSG